MLIVADIAYEGRNVGLANLTFGAFDLHFDNRWLESKFIPMGDNVNATVRAFRGYASPIPHCVQQVADESSERMPLKFLGQRFEDKISSGFFNVLGHFRHGFIRFYRGRNRGHASERTKLHARGCRLRGDDALKPC